MSWTSVIGSVLQSPAFGSFVGSATQGGMSLGEKWLGSAYNAHLQRDLMSNQDTLNRENWYNSLTLGPKLARQGLVDAGYNPLLALGGFSTSSPSGVSALAAQHSDGNSFGSFGKTFRDLLESSLVKDESKIKKAQAEDLQADKDLKDALKDKADADAIKSKVETVVEPVRAISSVGGSVATAYGAKKAFDALKGKKDSLPALKGKNDPLLSFLRNKSHGQSAKALSLGSKALQSLGIFALPLIPAASAYHMTKYLYDISPSARKIIDTPNLGSRLR